MGAAVLLLASLAFEDPPKDAIEFFRSAAAALGDADRDLNDGKEDARPHATEFLDHFDKSMPGYARFREQIEAMVGAGDVSTTIEFVNVQGEGSKLALDLDWSLQVHGKGPKRAVIKCTIEKRRKKWKITSIAPIEFFKLE